ncbi:hypothetical protein CI238_02349 [Colletotrichum incanum]|uniref:DUF7918 domain-containing protein n=1 Tax=Colletotrichum incanum TaxID=1573173 RepID=A0A167AAL6_COLIC|nr:hypothetical protein CI238_02349 [Colletotrichum incanum]OHW92681.1 hypothetical protein CSPAE12_08694 [Colletotrichum incanum]
MAIINGLPGVKITVQVDGQDAIEYDDPDGFENDTNRKNARWRTFSYVESKDDAFFSVRYQVDNSHRWDSPYHAFSLTLYVDGKRMDGVVCEARHFLNLDPFYVWETTVEGSREGSTASGYERLNKFKFSKVTMIDDAAKDRVEVDTQKAKALGVIEVFIYPMVITGPMRYTTTGQRPDAQNDGFEIAEKALKGRAVSHGTSFADGGIVSQKPTVTAEYLNNHNSIAAFSFKYRSRDALHKELIIPRSPSPEPIDGMSEAEIRRLAVERLQDINVVSPNSPTKQRNTDCLKNRRRSPTVKREGRRSIIKREYAEILDLTEEPIKREWKKVKIEGNRVAIDLTDD